MLIFQVNELARVKLRELLEILIQTHVIVEELDADLTSG